MKLIPATLMAAGAILAAPGANATPTLNTFGINAVAEVSNCFWNAAHTQCDWVESRVNRHIPAHNATGVTASVSDARGTAWAGGAISATTYLPTMPAYSFSNQAAAGGPAPAPVGALTSRP